MGGPRPRLGAGGAALAVAAGLAVSLAAPTGASAEDPPFVPWTQALPGVPMPFAPSAEPDCADGDDACIDRTLGRMYRRFDRLYAACDHNSLFALVYIRVTEAIRLAIRRGHFQEPRFLNHEDAVFARMYFVAFDTWARGDRAAVPPAWLEALDAARRRSVSGVGNLLMSMNAHVNRDMPFMLASLGTTKPDGSSRKPDHDRGNAVLHPLYDDTFEEIARRWDPSVRAYEDPGTPADDLVLFQVLPAWREQVWRHAEMLRAAPTPEARRQIADYIESYAVENARFIRSQTTIADSSARDAHCRRYRETHRERGTLARPVIGRRGLRVTRRGLARVRLRCPSGIRDCDGTLALSSRRRRATLGERRFRAIRPRRTERVHVRLGRRARRSLGRHGRLSAYAVVRTTTPWGMPVETARRARLTRGAARAR